MGKLVFVFPGQGSQKVGMGSDLAESDAEVFDRHLTMADEASGLEVRRLCLEGPMEELTKTEVAQPALFAVGMALNELGREMGLAPDFVAGHSLGEYTAAAASGALSPEDGIRLVSERGRRMAEIGAERPGTMAAILGLEADTLAELCERASEAGVVGLANLNTATQTVVSGEVDGVLKVMELAEEAGAAKTIRLQVTGAFHSELMKPVQSELADTMDRISWSDPEVPLVANHSGQAVTTGDDVREALVAQIASPVRWVDCVQTLVDEGADRSLELGPGRVLSGLIRKISPDIETLNADSRQGLEALVASSPPDGA